MCYQCWKWSVIRNEIAFYLPGFFLVGSSPGAVSCFLMCLQAGTRSPEKMFVSIAGRRLVSRSVGKWLEQQDGKQGM